MALGRSLSRKVPCGHQHRLSALRQRLCSAAPYLLAQCRRRLTQLATVAATAGTQTPKCISKVRASHITKIAGGTHIRATPAITGTMPTMTMMQIMDIGETASGITSKWHKPLLVMPAGAVALQPDKRLTAKSLHQYSKRVALHLVHETPSTKKRSSMAG
jgi:hypothetical protein